MTLFRRVAGVLLALLGMVVLVTIVPVLSHLDQDGRAVFTADVDTTAPGAEGIVSIDQHVLNRVDAPVSVTAHGTDGTRVFIGAAAPSAVGHLVGQGALTRVTAVTLEGWTLVTDTTGKGAGAEPSRAPIWERTALEEGTASLTLDQADAPQRVLVTTPKGGRLASVEIAYTDPGWRRTAIWLTVVGVLLLLGGGLLALWGWRPRRATADVNAATTADTTAATTVASTDADGTQADRTTTEA